MLESHIDLCGLSEKLLEILSGIYEIVFLNMSIHVHLHFFLRYVTKIGGRKMTMHGWERIQIVAMSNKVSRV